MKNTPPPQVVTLDVSWQALLKIVAMAGLIWLTIVLRPIILMLFVVFIFVAAVHPTIQLFQRKMSRRLAVVLFYTLLLLAVVLVSYIFIPRLISQINYLNRVFPGIVDQLRPYASTLHSARYSNFLDQALQNISGGLQSLTSNLFGTLLNVFGGIATVATGFVLSFYLLLEENNAREFFHQVLPQNRYHAAYVAVRKISEQLGSWIQGQLTVMLVVGVLNFLSYAIIGVPSPLPLGMWSGLCEAIPYLGPVLGVIPGIVVAAASGHLFRLLWVVVVNYVIIQQFQNYYVTPTVMRRAIGLSPVLIILAVLVGISLFGMFGALIALPGAAIVSVVVTEWPNLRTIWEQDEPEEAKE